jgi:hypothetical protein
LRRRLVLSLFCLTLMLTAEGRAGDPVEALTFFSEPGRIFVPLAEGAARLGWPVRCRTDGAIVVDRKYALAKQDCRALMDGSLLIDLQTLAKAGARVTIGADEVTVRDGWRGFAVVVAGQRVEISLKEQVLRGWEGSRLVLQTHISSGRDNRTPAGNFTAGPFRSRMHYSKLYHNAPMPWSVQIYGHVFIHRFDSVPDHPASHGCIRMPLTDGNPARFFYEWVKDGTPVRVTRE